MAIIQNISGEKITIFASDDRDKKYGVVFEPGQISHIKDKIYSDSDDIDRLIRDGKIYVLEYPADQAKTFWSGSVQYYADLPDPNPLPEGIIYIVREDSPGYDNGFYIIENNAWEFFNDFNFHKASEVENDSGAPGTNVAESLDYFDVNAIKKDGSIDFEADQDHGGFKITGLAGGIAGTDAVNKNQLDLKADLSSVILKDGSVAFISDQSMGGNNLTNLADGVNPQDAVTFSQLSSLIPTSGAILKDGSVTYEADQPMGGYILTGLGAGASAADSVNKGQLDLKADDADVIKKDGSVDFTGNQSMGSNKLTNVANGTNILDAVNKGQLDTKADYADVILKDGSVAFTGNQSMGGNQLTNLAAPLAGADAVPRDWVLNQIAQNDWQNSVKNIGLNTPPPSPVLDDRHIVGTAPTGAWSGQANDIATWDGSSWTFIDPNDGFIAFVEDEDKYYSYNGVSWVKLDTLIDHTLIQNVGTNDHAAIDSHIADLSIHFSKDHGGLTGLSDNDHPQYALVSGSIAQFATKDHHLLTGLTDDDHTQYHTDARGDARYYRKTQFINTSAGIPDAGSPIVLDAAGKLDVSFLDQSDIDHTQISNIGSNSHTAIDSHISDSTIHFTEGSIDHNSIQNNGTYQHGQIDNHINDSTIHFTEGSIVHANISGLSANDHPQYVLVAGDTMTGFLTLSADPTNNLHAVTKQYVDNAFTNLQHHDLGGLLDDDHTQYHNNSRGDLRYYRQNQFVTTSSGVPDSGKPILLDASGKIDPSLYDFGDISHSSLANLSADDHTQYHNDTRGDARYYRQTQFINASTGVSDAGKPIKLDASGKLDPSFYDQSDIDHGSISGLSDNDHPQYVLKAGDTLTGFLTLHANPVNNFHAATKQYVDNELSGWEHHDLNGLSDNDHPQYVLDAGDTMTGFLTLHADPTNNLHAATKQYVDASITAIDHGSLTGLSDDDHTQYLNQARGDSRYYTQSQLDGGQLDNRYYRENEHINASSGVGDAGKPIILDASGKLDSSFYDQSDIDHTLISNIGTNSHAAIDTHIADGTIHFTEASITHANISGLAADDHPQYVLDAGDTMTGFLTLNADPTNAFHAATKNYVDNRFTNLQHHDLLGLSDNDHPQYVLDSGDTMTGFLTLHADPTNNLHAATKQYVDSLSHSSLSGLGADDHTQYHNNARGDARYFQQTQFVVTSAGVANAGDPIVLDASGKLDPSLYDFGDISHSSLSNLSADDHTQYHNNARGDARYYQQTQFIQTSAGAGDGGKPIILDASGRIDASMINDGDIDHSNLTGLTTGDDHPQYLLKSGGSMTGYITLHAAPTLDFHAATKKYVDDNIPTTLDHGSLTGLLDDDHTQYVLKSGSITQITTRNHNLLSSIGANDHHNQVHGLSSSDHTGVLDWTKVSKTGANITDIPTRNHHDLQGLTDDDHSQYILVNGSRAFTGVVGGITPTAQNHLTTKGYVDGLVQGIDWKESVKSRYDPTTSTPPGPATGDRYISTATANGWTTDYIYEWNGSSWTEIIPNEGAATWVEDENVDYRYNGSSWVKMGSTIDHDNLINTHNLTTDIDHGSIVGLSDDDHTQYHNDTRGDARYYQKTEFISTSGGAGDAGKPIVLDSAGFIDASMIDDSDIDHGNLTGLSDDDHPQYVLKSGSITQINSRNHSDLQSINANDHHNQVHNINGTDHTGSLDWSKVNKTGSSIADLATKDHDLLDGLTDDDHTQYILVNGTRAFTGDQSMGTNKITDVVDPTNNQDAATKKYVDDQVAGGSLDTIVLSAARYFTVTNIYLQADGVYTNVVPLVLPYNATLVAISAATNGAETWTAEVHLNGSLVTGAALSISAASSGYNNSYNIDFNAGDGIQLYCNGSSITNPRIIAYFKRR